MPRRPPRRCAAPGRRETTIRVFVGAYIVLFFAYLFGPLIIMSITAFNSSSFPARRAVGVLHLRVVRRPPPTSG
jgi:hypothetical protein